MAYNKSNKKSKLALFLLILAGIVVGGFLGSLVENVKFLSWLNFGFTFGMKTPLDLDFKVVFLLFRITMDITIASLVGIAIAIFVYRKI